MGRMSIAQKKSLCAGCADDFYNRANSQCWRLKHARVVKRKEVHIRDIPPWKYQRVFKTLDCYHRPGYVYVAPGREC